MDEARLNRLLRIQWFWYALTLTLVLCALSLNLLVYLEVRQVLNNQEILLDRLHKKYDLQQDE